MEIDLNADLGEGCGADDDLLRLVTSCSIACGGHAGDAESMTRAVASAAARGVALGAHPAYPDPENFGRVSLDIGAAALEAALAEQIGRLAEIARDEGAALRHVKPHGALYHDADRDGDLAALVVRLAPAGAGIYGPPGGALEAAARDRGAPFAAEGFADRGYGADGRLAERGEPGATIEDPKDAAAQALDLAHGRVLTIGGDILRLSPRTLCLHGDAPGAVARSRAVRAAFEAAGVDLRAPFAP